MKVKTLVITGDGLNCEKETARAFSLAQSESEIIHINDLLEKPDFIQEFHILAIPGGFSFGDEVGSGQILALKLKHGFSEVLEKFIQKKKLIIGICNGFQALVKLGLLPNPFSQRVASLTYNKSREFIDKWVTLKGESETCIWTKGIKEISLPIRHGEGRIVFSSDDVYSKLKSNGQIVFQYTEDVNGSFEKVAALCDPSGLILGLMPHPEAAISQMLSPQGERVLKRGDGLLIFENAVSYVKENLL